MARNRSISVILKAEVGQYTKAMADAAKASEKLGADATKAAKEAAAAQGEQKRQAQELVSSYQQLGAPLMAVGGAMTAVSVAVLKTGISYNQLQQQSRAAMTTLLGGATAANAQMDKLDDFAKTSPFSKATFITAQQQMLAFGIETEKVLPYLDAMQDAVAASGGSNQQLSEVAFVMAQISSAGKITGQDLIQFGQRGINAAELIGSQMGKTGAQIRTDITDGAIGADEALDALAAGMNQKFDGAAENVKSTFLGALDRVSAAWRDFSSTMAEPLVGTNSGGLGVAGLNKLADTMRAFQKLPDWLQLVAGGLFAAAGMATLATGAFLSLTPRIVATKVALAQMSPRVQGAVGHVGTMAKGLGIATAAFVAYTIAAETGVFATESFSESANDIVRILAGLDGDGSLDQVFTASTEAKSWVTAIPIIGGWAASAATEISGLDDAFKSLSGTSKTLGGLQTAGGLFGDSSTDLALAQFEKVDSALTKLYADGRSKEAADWHDQIAESAARHGVKTKELAELLPGYSAALTDTDLATQGAVDSTSALAEALGMEKGEFQARTESVAKQAEKWFDLGKAAESSKGKLKGFLDELKTQAKALEELTKNATKAAELGLDQGIVDSFASMGPVGAKMLAEIVAGGKDAVAETEKTFGAMSKATDGWIDSLGGIPGVVETTAKWNDAAARAKLKVFKSYVTSTNLTIPVKLKMPGRLPTLNDIYAPKRTDADGGIYQYADGGFDERGNRVPRVPQMRSGSQGTVMWGEPETGWEAYISGKPGMEDRNRAIASLAVEKLGGVAAFANGGVTADSSADYLRLQQRIKDMQKDLGAKEGKGSKRRNKLRGLDRQIMYEELAEAKADLAEQKSMRKQIGKGRKYASVDAYNQAQDFMGDFQLDKLSSPAGVERYLTRRLGEMAEFTTVLGNLKGRGASPWLLNELIRIGPNKGTIRLGKKYLADHQALLRVNGLADQAQNTSAIFGSMTTHANWSNSKAASVLTAGQSAQLIDYSKLAKAMTQVQLNLNVDGRQAGLINQAGTNFAGAYS